MPRVAILPFRSIGAGEASAFTEGLHGDLLVRLAQVSGLQVISQISVEQYRDTEKTTAEVVNPRTDTYA